MFDYRGIEALYVVQELQSFEAAAKKLKITQSAVSQRIKGLEVQHGEPLLIRTLPYTPTRLGTQLIGHFKRICLLEESLQRQLDPANGLPHIAIALNRDSLETWFLDFMEEREFFSKVILEIIADDQELTLNYLKNGRVSACLSTTSKEVAAGQVHFLGNMEYVLTASPYFVQKYFSSKNQKKGLKNAPAVKFDLNDKLHENYIEKFFGFKGDELNFHIIPSVRGFKKFILSGCGYALMPKIDIQNELMTQELISIYPDKTYQVPLYWHCWAIQSKFYQEFNSNIVAYVTKKLKNQ